MTPVRTLIKTVTAAAVVLTTLPAAAAVGQIEVASERRQANAFAVAHQGRTYWVTAAHALGKSTRAWIRPADVALRCRARVAAKDVNADVAVLAAPRLSQLKPLVIAGDMPAAGSVLAATAHRPGAGWGRAKATVRMTNVPTPHGDLLEIRGPFGAGTSGAALQTADGAVAGMVVFGVGDTPTRVFAVPADVLEDVLNHAARANVRQPAATVACRR